MGTPIASGVSVEKVMATQAKRLASGTVGSVASNALMDRYDLNPYVAMGIGMGISKPIYSQLESIKVDTKTGITALDVKGVEAVDHVKVVEKVFGGDGRSWTQYSWKLDCDCAECASIEINSMRVFQELKEYFGTQVKRGIFVEVKEKNKKPLYVWKESERKVEWYATKWYRYQSCGWLWEFDYPDFPAKGFVRKFYNGIYYQKE